MNAKTLMSFNIITMRELALPFTIPVSGISNYQDRAVMVKVGDPVSIRREPTNPYDTNACALVHKNHLIGYVPKALAHRLVASSADAWSGTVSEVLGTETIGLRVRIEKALHKEPEKAPAEKIEAKVYAKSGRELGVLKRIEDGMVVVINPHGVEIPYPKDLVVLQKD